ncbi:MAG: hypothetical protein P4M11_00590 [Candidatus Pacebacteria bacterium]|nr:hypothetical protein [Candidatus Paceibacterota bacterium]
MHALESTIVRYPMLHAFETRVHGGITMLGRKAWQHATPIMQEKYPRFALTANEYFDVKEAYADGIATLACLPMDRVRNIIDDLADLDCVWREERSFHDARTAGLALQRISFAGSRLGGDASRGDLELHLRLRQIDYDRNFGKEFKLSYRALLEEYDRGENRDMFLIVSEWFESAAASLAMDTQGLGKQTNPCLHAPSPWHADSYGEVFLSEDVLETGYHLYASLLRLFQPIEGRA